MNKWTRLISAATLALAFAGDAEPAAADVINCAGQGQGCPITESGVAILTYGAKQTFGLMTENQRVVGCGNGTFGDPLPGQDKGCSYEVREGFKDRSFKTCAGEGRGTCKTGLKSGEIKLARYGTPNGQRWLYAYVGSDFECRTGGLGSDLDPAPGVGKECQVAAELESALSGQWSACATEGQRCTFSDSEPRLVRYGDNSRMLYKLFVGTQLDCNNATFRHDPAPGAGKACAVLKVPLSARLVRMRGSWQKLLRCKGCSSTEYAFTTGVTSGKEDVKSKEWAASLTVSLEKTAGAEAGGVKSEVKVGFSATVSHSVAESIATSFTREKGTEKRMSCDKGALYQFVTSVEEVCGGGVCESVANSDEFDCRTPSEPGPTGSPD